MNGNEIDKSLSKMPRPLPEGQGAAGASFISKPARGWLHSDQQIAKEGITYAVRYVGCLEILTSMKSLDFETRSQVAKECINRVCEAAGLKTADKKRKVEKRVQRAIAEQPLMEHAGANVNLTISSCSLVLTALESGRVIAGHDMPRISFASGGDTDTLDFVAYVAKDLKDWRACYVLECGGGLAQDVITTIGQAFELRFKEFLTRPASITMCLNGADRDYYNDLPGKIPPELGPPPVPPLPNFHGTQPSMKSSAIGSDTIPRDHSVVQQREPSERTVPREGVTSNLIDLNCEVAPPPPMPAPRREHDYVNDIVIGGNRDVFDMHERIKCYEEEMAFLKKMQEEYTESPPSSDIDERENVMKDMGWVRNLLEEMEDLRPELSVPFHSSIISKGVNEIDKLKGVRETDYEADGEVSD
ncbi:SHC-transforming protein 1 isoform X2 [Anabrus simplex]|uniref:SHC-transforming protein 1 isoform X2 n=1 Tax=Anabrus simplex TaxID=316456 RepID=UPI0035A378EA